MRLNFHIFHALKHIKKPFKRRLKGAYRKNGVLTDYIYQLYNEKVFFEFLPLLLYGKYFKAIC